MLISIIAFSAMNIGVRAVSSELPPGVIVTLRNILTLGLLVPLVARNRFAIVRTKRLKAHIARSTIGAVGMLTWTYCLTIMPVNHATALSFTAPLFATLFAVLFLREHAHTTRWICLIAGFCGTLIILNPSAADFKWSSLLVMFATSAWATTSMLVKSLSATEPPLRMVFYMNLFMFLLALPVGFLHWQWPSLHGWEILLLIAICSVTMHFTMAKAYSMVPVVTLLPLDFLRLLFTSLFAYIIFGETSNLNTWIGAAVIIASAVVMARRDAKAANHLGDDA